MRRPEGPVHIPADVPPADKIFSTRRLVPDGLVEDIRYVVYVDPGAYAREADNVTRLELARIVGRLNRRLEGETFILAGPGRWGSANTDLGVKITYADIYNTRALIEIALARGDAVPEPSYGTHFFQDLVEARIYPLALFPDDPGAVFKRSFFDDSPNSLPGLLPADAGCAHLLKVIDVPACHAGRRLTLVMDGERGEALAYLQ